MCRFTAPRLHATDRSVRRTLGGGFPMVGERGSSLSLPVCPRPCAGGKANQNSTVLTRGKNCPSTCDHDGLWQPAAARVSSGFLIAVIIASRFLRLRELEVKRPDFFEPMLQIIPLLTTLDAHPIRELRNDN